MALDSLQDQLQRALGAGYRIEREIGAGGMATVFAAVETSLGRRVAIKVLQPELVAELSTDRFAREVRLAASLQQANIVPLLSAGVAGGLSYYTMPLVDGSSLRARVASGVPVSLSEAISILKDIARALAYAHHAGVVHRDIKPDNVLLSGGTAVVSDFGIAKAMDAARTGNATTITNPGSALGTPGYMAPEQVAGENVDHRADIYAWGVVAWELLAMRHPFASRTTRQAMLAAHLTEEPPAIAEQATDVPAPLATLVMRCLAKDPDRRPQSANELLAVLEAVATPPHGRPIASNLPRRVAAVVVGIAVVGAALVTLPRVRTGNQTAAVVDSGPPSVAVLPFENIGGDTAQEYFAEGMTDELATALGRLPGLRVAARSAAYRYKGRRDIDVRQVGADLGVRYLLSGSVRRTGQQLRLSAQLTESADAVEIWSDRYTRPADDVFALQDSLTTAITSALAERLGPPGSVAPSAATNRGTKSHAAYELYLKGNYYLYRRRPGLEGARRSFEAAIATDTNFARAYAGLASTVALLSYFGSTPVPDRVARVAENARRALQLDSTVAEAHVALGIMYGAVNQLERSETELRLAIALEPDNAQAHFHLARMLLYLGRLQEGVDELERAKILEPYHATIATWLGLALVRPGNVDRAVEEAMRAWELDSLAAVVQNTTAVTFILTGRLGEGRRIAVWAPKNNVNGGTLAWVLGAADSLEAARAFIRSVDARGGTGWLDQFNVSMAALILEDTARALAAMETSLERDEPVAAFLPLYLRIYDPVRSTARFRAILRRVGINESTLMEARRASP
jgi:serine/threonine-protein kinase